MTTDIKSLMTIAREYAATKELLRGEAGAGTNYLRQLCDALEAMAGEVDSLKHDIARHMTIANEAAAERDRLKAALDIAKAHAKQNQRARDLVSPYPNDHAKRIVWEKALYHEGKDLWDKLRKALGGDE